MSSTVIAPGGLEISSSSESAASMLESLTPKTEGKSPRITIDAGEPVKEPDEVSEAAAKLGKKGGEATAAKKAEAKELKAKPIPEEKPEPVKVEAKPEEVEETPEEKAEGNRRKDPIARMKLATEREAEAKRELVRERDRNDRLEQRLAEIERRSAPPAKEAFRPAPAADDDPEPQEGNFEDWKDYTKALGAHAARQEHKRLMTTTRETAQREYMAHTYATKIAGTMDSFGKQMAEASESDPSFLDDTAEIRGELVPSWALEPGEKRVAMNIVADEVSRAEKAPLLLRHLAEHPEDLDRIKRLGSPDDVRVEVRFIARGLEAAISGNGAKPKVSQANPPIRPVIGTPPAAEHDLNVDGLDFNTFMSRSKARRG